ncbi:phosphoenolpyruvate carboxykinase (GTP) [Yasminevirus sp. GU-2018]|uniref:phosphoenolpyruvate carboxykinase (GTP) n=1 Tax=Yasminevirus sp. GU-2018 TaxID=2420051 RepID=A0A5K0UBE1_9VIRU|nr:phosphoenolpyruvate carboxykinase (GTP) [Yasminevirus sp. GU-2018]
MPQENKKNVCIHSDTSGCEKKEDDSLFGGVNSSVLSWIKDWINVLSPKNHVLCNGSDEQYAEFCSQMVREGRMIKLNENLYDNCYLCRSDPNDVARTEDRTFICTSSKDEAGPTNNWLAPSDAKSTLAKLMTGCMKGRTMYIIPFSMGDPKSPVAQIGIQLTDSLYVAISMKVMARSIDVKNVPSEFIKCVHSVGASLETNQQDVMWPCSTTKYICHFPETLEVISYGSGYGGNALLGKKCLALRLASYMGRKQGWLAEHMLILKMTKLEKNQHESSKSIYVTAAFPSACGKTNLAML